MNLTFWRRLRAALAVLFGRVTARPLDEYYLEARRGMVNRDGREGQLVSVDALRAPLVWRSSPGHVIAYLAYISADEAALLSAIDLHGSGVDEKMHFGPYGVPSYQGDGGDGGGDGSGADSSGDDGEGDDGEDDSGPGLEGDPDTGFDTPASIMSEANFGIGPDEFGAGRASAEAGPDSDAGGGISQDSIPLAPESTPTPEPTHAESLLASLLKAPPTEMPFSENSSARLARRRAVASQLQRRGRSSTILTDSLGGGSGL